MATFFLDIDDGAVDVVLKAISNHQLAIIPTDTIYGLICDATSFEAVHSLYTLKKRDRNKPVAILLPSIAEAEKLVSFSNKERKILNRFGGRITLIKEYICSDRFPAELINSSGEIGIRIPDHKFCKNVLEKFGRPIAATSANISGELPSNPSLLPESFLDKVNVVVTGDTSSIQSTIIRCNDVGIETIRGIAIDEEMLSVAD